MVILNKLVLETIVHEFGKTLKNYYGKKKCSNNPLMTMFILWVSASRVERKARGAESESSSQDL